ncbi:YtxH domain-containing protein [Cohnella sp.]|uniref:YtxH domain-containing protein n=1 Tax=Cohnella sp. TaxID=1883426 RepID=UPI003568DD54
MAEKKAVKSFLWGTLAGAVTGVVTALLLAPKSGRELRSDISETAQQALEKTTDLSRQAGTAVQSLARKTTNLAVDAKQAAERVVTDIRSRKGSGAAVDNEVATAEEKSNEDTSATL